MEKKILTNDLAIGVFVCRLDRPWLDTPFMFQGFKVRLREEIALLGKYCRYVYIDTTKGKDVPTAVEQPVSEEKKHAFNRLLNTPAHSPRYPDIVPAAEEISVAKTIHEKASVEVTNLLHDVEHGKEINIPGAKQIVAQIVESIIRNPDAFAWLTRLKTSDSYTYKHCLDVCVLASTFGRHIGLPKEDLSKLGLAALLFDIGKLKLPQELLNKTGQLTENEVAVMRSHVRHSVQVLSQTKGVTQDIIEAVRCHHERHDGSGYPRRLMGEKIPFLGRIVAICDVYDALISKRCYGTQLSQLQAIGALYEWRGTLFHKALVEQFIQCIGAFPVGCLVEMTTGQVGVVISQNRVLRLQPRVLLILDHNKIRYDISPIIDLVKDTEIDEGERLAIKTVLEPGAYGIDLNENYL